jgi:hypothetical protein
MSLWPTASTTPPSMVRIATTHTSGAQSQRASPTATYRNRSTAPKAAIFVAAAMNAVTGVGAPW